MEASRQDLMARITLTQKGLLAEAAAIMVSQDSEGLVLYCPAGCLGSERLPSRRRWNCTETTLLVLYTLSLRPGFQYAQER